ncbi:MAG TPA: aldo/keto reductase [Verrucomicrobiota bacterium]|nr:aldo/keto reductase [Verrucomicrobiales bacterium]HRI12752.1 aldo/keto reductase [Verrucomicrobiota bacterium]
MRYRRFGRTQLQMPVFSCGGMRYQQSWSDVAWKDVKPEGQTNLEATIHRAVELGINHIETARGYGSSEMQLGPVLQKLPREKLIVQTKVTPKITAREFQETFETSLRYLGLAHVDLLSLHGINNREHLDQVLRRGGCLEVCRELQREGRVRFVGFSTHATPNVISEAIRSDEFDYVNVHWYFVNDLNRPCLAEAAQRDMGIFIISPNDKGGKLFLELPKLRSLCAPLTPMQFNDLYCLARPEIHTLSLGAARPADFDEHLGVFEHYERAAEVVAPIERRLRDEMERVLGADWCRRWWAGLPEYSEVPGEVNVVEILRLWTYAKPLELNEWAKFRYNMLGNADHWFPGEHAAKLDRQRLPEVLRNSPFSDSIPAILEEAHRLFHDAPVKRLSAS